MIVETATKSDINKICNEGFLYIKKNAKDLSKLQGRTIKVFVKGKSFYAKVSSNNRISGVKEMCAIFKNINQFDYYYDERKKAIVIKFSKITETDKSNNDLEKVHSTDKRDKEQYNIIEEIRNKIVGKSKKYKGAVVAEIIMNHLEKYVPNNYTIVGHNYFIHGIPDELDAMIVKKDRATLRNIYEPGDVKAILEIKMSGFFNTEKANDKLLVFKKIQHKYSNIRCILISARIKGYNQVKNFSDVFVLSNWNWNMSKYSGTWKDLANYIKNI